MKPESEPRTEIRNPVRETMCPDTPKEDAMNPAANHRRSQPLALFAALFLVAFAAVPAMAQCSLLWTYANRGVPGTLVTGFENYANMGGVAFVSGKGNVFVGTGTDSGNYPGYRPGSYTSPQYYWLKKYSATEVAIMGQTSQSPKWDACPNPSADFMTAAIWELVGEGTANHSARFVGATTRFDSPTARFNFSLAMEPANQKVLLAVPAPEVKAVLEDPSGLSVTLRIPSPQTGPGFPFADNAAFAGQYFAVGTPRPAVVTGWDVYATASSCAPLSGQVTSWMALGTVALNLTPGAMATSFSATLPTDGSTPLYFAVAPRFKDGFRPHLGSQGSPRYFVGPNSDPVVPSGLYGQVAEDQLSNLYAPEAGVVPEVDLPEFAPQELVLDAVPGMASGFLEGLGGGAHARESTWTVRWTSTDETETFYYEVVLSRPSGEILAVSDMILAAGEPSSYVAEVTASGSDAGPVVATVLVSRTDGTTLRSSEVGLRVPRSAEGGRAAR